MDDQPETEWPIGSPAWQAHQEQLLQEMPSIFEDPEPAEEAQPEPPPDPTAGLKPGTFYQWLKDDNWTSVTRKLKFTMKELVDHNGIEDAGAMHPGDILHLPIAQEVKPDLRPTFEVLPEPVPMHVNKPGGIKKWSFGNMKKWEDATAAGFFPGNTNLTIVAIAHVPLDEADKDGKPVEAAYYMDSNALGDYATTGRIRWTVGYMWSDLDEGHVDAFEPRKPKPVAEAKLREQKAKVVAKKSVDIASASPQEHYMEGFSRSFVEMRLADTLKFGSSHHFIDTLQPQRPSIPCTVILPAEAGEVDPETKRRFVWVHDFATQRRDRRLFHNQEVDIAATFEYDGVLYGRPERSAKAGEWFGIDMALLQADKDLYNTKLDAATRQAEGGTLTWSERFVWVPLAKVASHPALERRRKRKTKTST